ncbi:MAG: PEP/pyruvate-binding domain-containing protein [Trichloromonadaceae bacterium]
MERVTTGLKGLDTILDGLRLGDNVVWHLDELADYRQFVEPFVRSALEAGRRVVYLRFGQHDPVVPDYLPLTTYELDPRLGFESFASRTHAIITEEGPGVFYVFDSLSDLLSAWATDQMLGNFFRVTCPYLFELDTVAYFALIRGNHSFKTIARIRETTQLLLDVHALPDGTYIQPLKAWQRHSPTMFLPHRREGEHFLPVANSFEATTLLTDFARREMANAHRHLDHWHRLFLQAEELSGIADAEEQQGKMVRHLCHHLIGRDERILTLAHRYFSLEDLLAIKARMIGNGFLGGKAVGMLLARQILRQDSSFPWGEYLEPHDSFFIGSNVFYSYLVHNGWWQLFMQHKTAAGYFSAAQELGQKMLHGSFPDAVRDDLQKMLEYFGQYPIIVRSSALLEDGFGNAFAGKYDSFFLANQGSPEERYQQLEEAIRKVFASAMSEDALSYRQQRGLDQLEEQMALLVQRVSGCYRKHYYFPDLAGVGVSHNTFVWDRQMDPKAGMLRLVLGLGTRAVDRVEGDYPRIVALDAPLKRPHKGMEDVRRFSQRDVDLINVSANSLQTVSLLQLTQQELGLPMERYGVRDLETVARLEQRGRKSGDIWLLTFDKLLSDSDFTGLMQRLLKTLERVYAYPVDVEFTINFTAAVTPKINLVQCRPLQTKGEQVRIALPRHVPQERVFLRSEGHFMGGSIAQPLRRIIWVDPQQYSALPQSDKYEIARLIGRLNKRTPSREEMPTLLMGPGRWGTSTPSLGVPITFSEINHMVALAEVAFTSGNLMPELSFGSHFFQDLVETDIFYLALFPEDPSCLLNLAWLDQQPNALEGLMPASAKYKRVVKVVQLAPGQLQLMADLLSQQLICFSPEEIRS